MTERPTYEVTPHFGVQIIQNSKYNTKIQFKMVIQT